MANEQNPRPESDTVLGNQEPVSGFFHYLTKFSAERSLDNVVKDTISCVAISPDSQTVVGGGWKIIRLWHLSTGKLLRTLEGHSHWVLSVAISPDGNTLVSGSTDNTIKLWNLKTGQILKTLTGHSNWVNVVAISPNGKTLVSGSADKTIKVWELSTGKILHTLTKHSGSVCSLAISPDGQIIASGSTDNTINLWKLSNGSLIRSLEGNLDWVQAIVITPDSKALVSGSRDGSVKVWQGELFIAEKGVIKKNNITFFKGVATLASLALAKFTSGASLAIIPFLFAESSKPETRAKNNLNFRVLNTENLSGINSLSISSDGQTLVTGTDDKRIKIWNRDGQKSLTRHSGFISSVAISADGKTLVSGGQDWIMLWNLQTGEPLHSLEGCSRPRLSKIVIFPTQIQLEFGQTQVFNVTGLDQSNQQIDIGQVTWQAADCEIAQNGLFVAGKKEGKFTVTAKVGIFKASASVTIVEPPKLTRLVITPQQARCECGQSQSFSVRGLDQRNNEIKIKQVLWQATGGTIDKNGTFYADKIAGNFSITATVGSISTSVCINIVASPRLASLVVSPSRLELQFGQSQHFTVLGLDQYGNHINIGQVTWSTTGGSIQNDGAFLAGYKEETVTVTATVGEISVSAYVTVFEPPKLTTLLISPRQAEIKPGQRQRFSVQGLDQRGCEIAVGRVVWKATGGTIDQNGNFIADSNTKGKFKVTATAQFNISASADITVVSVLRHLYVFPNEISLKPEQTFTFDAIGFDQQGDPIQIKQVNWQCTRGGKINSNGTFTGGYEKREVIVTATVEGISHSATITLIPVLKRLQIYPQELVKLKPGESQTFTVVGFDQYGNTIDTGEIFWEATGGKIDQNGTFIAGHNATGNFKVTATAIQTPTSGVRAQLLTLGIYMRLVSRILSFVDFAQNNFMLKSAIKLVEKNYNSVDKTEDTEEKLTNREAAEFSFDIEAWLEKKSLKIIVRILELASQLCINTSKISASVEVTVVSGLRQLENYPFKAEFLHVNNLTSSVNNDNKNSLSKFIDNDNNFDYNIDKNSFETVSRGAGYDVYYRISDRHWFYKSQLFYDGYSINEFSDNYTGYSTYIGSEYADYLAYIDSISYFEYLMEE